MRDFLHNEKVVMKTHISRLYKIHYYFLIILIFLGMGAIGLGYVPLPVYISGFYISLTLLLVNLFLIIYTQIKTVYHSYYITNYRVIKMSGILKKDVEAWAYEKIVNIKVSQGPLGRLINMGTVDIVTFKQGALLLEHVRNPNRIMEVIYEIIESSKSAKTPEDRYQRGPNEEQNRDTGFRPGPWGEPDY